MESGELTGTYPGRDEYANGRTAAHEPGYSTGPFDQRLRSVANRYDLALGDPGDPQFDEAVVEFLQQLNADQF